MKKTYKISLVVILLGMLSLKSHAQLDTLKYLRENFEDKKSEYIGKPFSYLLSKMTKIQPKTCWAHGTNNRFIVPYSQFLFAEMDKSFSNHPIVLLIRWNPPLQRKDIEVYEKKNGFFFTTDEKAFYGDKIVGDIEVYR